MKIKQLKSKDIPPLRERLLKLQGGFCPICRKKIDRPVLDHEHKRKLKGSGLIRGVLCSTCNSFLGKIENSCKRYRITLQDLPNVLRRIADYIEQDHLPYMHPSEMPKKPKLTKRSYNKLKTAYTKFLKHKNVRGTKFPAYPKSGYLTKPLARLFDRLGIEPTFYQ